MNTLDLSLTTKALVPYFGHSSTTVQISARNAAQFLIPYVDKIHERYFFLNEKNIHDLVHASGRTMPVISSLKLFLAYGKIAGNCKLFLKEDLFSYAFSIMWGSSRDDEKILAVSVVKMLSIHCQATAEGDSFQDHGDYDDVTAMIDSKKETAPADLAAKLSDILAQLSRRVLSFTSNCSVKDFDHSMMREEFGAFKNSLEVLHEKYVESDEFLLQEMLVTQSVSSVLLDHVINLLEGKFLCVC